MNKKQLLKESEIRKLMKFANISTLSDGFVERINETYGMYDEDVMAEADEELDAAPDTEAPVADTDDAGLDVSADAEEAEAEIGPSPEEGEEETAGIMEPEKDSAVAEEAVELMTQALEAGLQSMGYDVTLTAEAGDEGPAPMTDPGETGDAPMSVDAGDLPPEGEDAEAGMPPAPPEDPAAMDAAPPGDEKDKLPMEEGDGLEEEFVNEITRRVAKRILTAARRK